MSQRTFTLTVVVDEAQAEWAYQILEKAESQLGQIIDDVRIHETIE